jgi:hypothetical protein
MGNIKINKEKHDVSWTEEAKVVQLWQAFVAEV